MAFVLAWMGDNGCRPFSRPVVPVTSIGEIASKSPPILPLPAPKPLDTRGARQLASDRGLGFFEAVLVADAP
jgi:hypothetical protein